MKYTRQRERAVIQVWAQEDEHAWSIFGQDNGAGFDPRHAHRLFGIFQRLHRADELEGTGVGLANVRQIVTRHGGTVHAIGALGEGPPSASRCPGQGEGWIPGGRGHHGMGCWLERFWHLSGSSLSGVSLFSRGRVYRRGCNGHFPEPVCFWDAPSDPTDHL
ncbi:ATP-binding protein [Deinococcus sp.]|uniref:sensor histidine kinase n=1 Tax=Deinococcus sp. TaxID=47478 RepID=UPI00286996D2|nr:ATP-binding protein [Deinococcus sp.]